MDPVWAADSRRGRVDISRMSALILGLPSHHISRDAQPGPSDARWSETYCPSTGKSAKSSKSFRSWLASQIKNPLSTTLRRKLV